MRALSTTLFTTLQLGLENGDGSEVNANEPSDNDTQHGVADDEDVHNGIINDDSDILAEVKLAQSSRESISNCYCQQLTVYQALNGI